MGQKRTSGLAKRGEYWHIEKEIFGRRIRGTTGTKSFEEAQAILARRIEELRQAIIFGVRPERVFAEAAVKYLRDYQDKDSIDSDASHLRMIMPYVKDLLLTRMHMGTLQSFIEARKKAGRKTRTINHGLKIVRHILNLAASEWIDENGLTWILTAPKIKLLPEYDNRAPQPLSWEQEDRLVAALPEHLRNMALFSMYTGSRDREVCRLRWEWEVRIPQLNASAFIIPAFAMLNGERVRLIKNGQERLIILSKVAQKVIETVRGQDPEFVFTYRGKPIDRMLNSAWKTARLRSNLPTLRVHDLKHTYGRRLRAAGVSYEDRQDLLGHKSGRITTHYSAAEMAKLLEAANKACDKQASTPTLMLLKSAA